MKEKAKQLLQEEGAEILSIKEKGRNIVITVKASQDKGADVCVTVRIVEKIKEFFSLSKIRYWNKGMESVLSFPKR